MDIATEPTAVGHPNKEVEIENEGASHEDGEQQSFVIHKGGGDSGSTPLHNQQQILVQEIAWDRAEWQDWLI